MAIVPVTAMPYAAPSACDDLKNDDEKQAPDHRALC